ncbi:MAG: glycerol-3-phosphate dehydrogenase/oxidase [Actinomycetota bacterium]|nr:glycerol-3-phosphate dehydrogenase/oxidase [Actinomycetota bacterium]
MNAEHKGLGTRSRSAVWASLDQTWDVVVVGGGITGAAVAREAARLGLRTLLVEQRDFAWGSSSRSSKLVHGGLRYLKEGKIGLTRDAVRERKRLLEEGPGLVDPLGFLLATYDGDHPGRLVYRLGLSLYDVLALQWRHTFHDPGEFRFLAPHIKVAGLRGGFRFLDARTDDARLVLRVIEEAVRCGATALNYAAAVDLLRSEGRVAGVHVRDVETGRTIEVRARAVVNATGAWADELRDRVGGESLIRPLRGSHLVVPAWRLPAPQAVTFLHPQDRRPIFVFPWEGVTIVGTTDVDHEAPLNDEPTISEAEAAYLIEGVRSSFPTLDLGPADVTATFAGVRPVVGSGKADPSEESRDHLILNDQGMITVTGGKLTTFRLIARDVINVLHTTFPNVPPAGSDAPALDPTEPLVSKELDGDAARIEAWYTSSADALLRAARPEELAPIAGTPLLWAELRWAARSEAVVHLDDLLLRRVRIGLLLSGGGVDQLPRVRTVVQAELGWDDQRWEQEAERYADLWRRTHRLPDLSAPVARAS